MVEPIPAERIQRHQSDCFNASGKYILYWMTSARRPFDNFALQHALHYAQQLQKPLLVFEALTCSYQWASERMHTFVIDGMIANQRAFQHKSILYFPYIERHKGNQKGLLDSLALDACVVVTDYFPAFFLPKILHKASTTVSRQFDVVDSTGVMPLYTSPKAFTTAASFRRHLQKNITPHLNQMPQYNPIESATLKGNIQVDKKILAQWPPADLDSIERNKRQFTQVLPINQTIPALKLTGGHHHALDAWSHFLSNNLSTYETDRMKIEGGGTSNLSPYLHFGHISPHTIIRDLLTRENWQPSQAPKKATGSRSGWWGFESATEAFIDQILTWRELGYTFCHHRPDDYDQYESLPSWAQITLEEHASDKRPYIYDMNKLDQAQTHDPLWNAAQRQLIREGRIHNYLRMLWGKKILEWADHPQEALQILIELNNKYAIDGRNPNSWSGIFWILGRFDRAWGPERPIFGKVRYMSSENTARKIKCKNYLATWGQA